MPFDDTQKAEIAAIITESLKGEAFNAAIGEAIKGPIAGAFKGLKLDEAIKAEVAKAVGAVKPPENEEGEKSKDKKKDAGTSTDPRVVAQLDSLKADLEKERKAREDAENARKQDALLSAARAAFKKGGVADERLGHVLAVIHNAEGRLQYSEDGVPGMKFQRKGYDEVVPLESAVEEYLKTDDGKSFLPPRGVNGTGTGPGNTRAPKDAKGEADWGALRSKVSLSAIARASS